VLPRLAVERQVAIPDHGVGQGLRRRELQRCGARDRASRGRGVGVGPALPVVLVLAEARVPQAAAGPGGVCRRKRDGCRALV
jgi:hypothetical protein